MLGNRQASQQMYDAAVTAANDRSHQDHLDRAYRLFVSACNVDPTYGQAFYQLGNNTADLKKNHAAIAMWRRALECENRPDEKGRILTNLGWYLHEIGQIDEAVTLTEQATLLLPKEPAAFTNLSQMYVILDEPELAVAHAQKGFDLDPKNVQAEIALAFSQMFNRQFAEGLQHFEKRFEWRLKGYLHSPYPQWQGEPDGTLYLMSDQGLGDTLSFARFVKQAAERCKYIHASIHPELMRLFAHAFLGIKNINLIPQPNAFPQADYWTTFMSLPAAMSLTDQQIIDQPHIDCPRFAAPSNWKLPDRKLHIGIAWKGNPLSDIDRHRSIPLEMFMELYRTPGIQLYSLQMDDSSKQLYEELALGVIPDLKPFIRDVSETIGVLQHLDMVISLESALGHICGLAGKECWIPYSYSGRDWRAGPRGDKNIWYPNHRFFRMEKGEGWKPVFDRINEALQEKIDGLAESNSRKIAAA